MKLLHLRLFKNWPNSYLQQHYP